MVPALKRSYLIGLLVLISTWFNPAAGPDRRLTAALVRHSGYDAVGVTLQLYDHGVAIQKKGAGCAGQDIQDARNVADQIGIPSGMSLGVPFLLMIVFLLARPTGLLKAKEARP